MEKERSPYSTDIINTDALANYQADASLSTRPSAAVTTADPDATYSTRKDERFFLSRARHDRKELIRLLIELALLMGVIAAIAIPRLQSAVNSNQSFYARAAASFVGWTGTGPYGARIAVLILACQHDPCANVTLDVAIQDEPHDTVRHYILGGEYLKATEIYIDSIQIGGIVYTADIVTDHAVQGSITTGLAVLILKRGTSDERFNLTSATLDQISNYFGE